MRKTYAVTITGQLVIDDSDIELDGAEEGSIEYEELMLEEAERLADEVIDGIALRDPQVEVNDG